MLVLVGNGPMKNEYLKTAEEYKIIDKIFFIDAVPYKTLGQFSVDADIGLSVIQPISKSYKHALPNKLFEYAAIGLPTICSDLPAMKNMVNQCGSGIAIMPNSEIEFINAYRKIMRHYNQYVLKEEKRQNLIWNHHNQLNHVINE